MSFLQSVGDESRRVQGRLLYPVDDPGERLEYTGDLCHRLPWGNGTMIWTHGATYQGQWIEGKRSGFGLYTYNPDLLDAELNEEDDDFLVSVPVHDLDFSENDRSLNEIPDSSDHESVKEKYTMEQIHTRLFRMKPTEGNNFI